MDEETAVHFALAAYMAGDSAIPAAAEAVLVKHQSTSLEGLKSLFSSPAKGPIVHRLKALVGDFDRELKLIEEMRNNG